MHSLALPVFSFLCKTFSKLLKLILSCFVDNFLKNSYIQRKKICMAIKLWELQKNLNLKDAAKKESCEAV